MSRWVKGTATDWRQLKRQLNRKENVGSNDLPQGGTAGQVLSKIDGTDYNVEWATVSGGGGATTWGSITGTLSAQTDLQTALDLKLEDAPSDGSQYARQNGAWAVVTGGGGSVDESADYDWTGQHTFNQSTFFYSNAVIDRTSGSAHTKLIMAASDGYETGVSFRKSGAALADQRWYIQCENTSETGSNAGSDLFVSRYDDSGTLLDSDAVHIDRDTGSFNVNGNGSANPTGISVSAAIGQVSTFNIRKGGVLRWQFRCDNTSETGSNAGSNLSIRAVDDSGSIVAHDVLEIERSSGEITVGSGCGFVNLYSYFSVWAEENAGLGTSNTDEWAFGNGANTPSSQGVPVGVDCELYAGGWVGNGGTASIGIYRNGTQVATVTGVNTTFTAVSFSAGDIVGFRTISSSGTGSPNTITAHFRVPLIAS